MKSSYFYIAGIALSGGVTYNVLRNLCVNKDERCYASSWEQINIFNYGFFFGMGLGSSIIYLNSKLLKPSD